MDADFDDLFDGEDVLEDSIQESLTSVHGSQSQYLDKYDDDEDQMFDSSFTNVSHDSTPFISDKSINSEIHSGASKTTSPPTTISKIEDVFKDMNSALSNEKSEISVTLKIRQRQLRISQRPDETLRTRRLRFPGTSEDEAWRFTVVVRILELIHGALSNDTVLSKRDIYYRDPALFGRQSVVDRYVDDIAYTFNVPRSGLNITAAAKGLLVGALKFCRRDGSQIDASSEKEGMLIPSLKDILSVNMTAVKWILVIEKEATFRSIIASSFWCDGVALTAKGYPDLASRAMLHFMATPSPLNGFASPKVFGLADFDPDGMAILSVYKNGSLALAHENDDLCVPQLERIGLSGEHIALGANTVHGEQGLLQLTRRDRKMARRLLEQNMSSSSDADEAVPGELQVMLMLNTKAELQILDAVPGGMANLLSGLMTDADRL